MADPVPSASRACQTARRWRALFAPRRSAAVDGRGRWGDDPPPRSPAGIAVPARRKIVEALPPRDARAGVAAAFR